MLFSDSVKLPGVTLDSTLSFDKHVSNDARSCCIHIRALKQIKPYLSLDSANAAGDVLRVHYRSMNVMFHFHKVV